MDYNRQSIFRKKSNGKILVYIESYGNTIRLCGLNGAEIFNSSSVEYLGQDNDIMLVGKATVGHVYYPFGDYKFIDDGLLTLGKIDANDKSLPFRMLNDKGNVVEWANAISTIPFSTIEWRWSRNEPKQVVSTINGTCTLVQLQCTDEESDSTISLPQMQRPIL